MATACPVVLRPGAGDVDRVALLVGSGRGVDGRFLHRLAGRCWLDRGLLRRLNGRWVCGGRVGVRLVLALWRTLRIGRLRIFSRSFVFLVRGCLLDGKLCL
nr:MAG TPA: hypothetical protein [Caudoviricetes sp.]